VLTELAPRLGLEPKGREPPLIGEQDSDCAWRRYLQTV